MTERTPYEVHLNRTQVREFQDLLDKTGLTVQDALLYGLSLLTAAVRAGCWEKPERKVSEKWAKAFGEPVLHKEQPDAPSHHRIPR